MSTAMTRTPPARRALAAAGLALAAGLGAGPSACTDVTVEPRSSIGTANVFADSAAYQAYVAKLYAGFALSGGNGAGASDITGIDAGFGQYLRVLWNLEELPTDEAILAWNDQAAGVQQLNTQTWTPDNGSSSALYSRILLQATLASDFLRQTTDDQLAARNLGPGARALVRRYRAEARFVRALVYFHAIDVYGSVPLVTEETAIGTTPAQATRQRLFDFAVSELTAARADLPAANRADPTQYGRATQAAADMLLATLYLNAQVYTGTARYTEALAAATSVINSGAFSLDPSYQHLFLADNNTSPELVFVVTQDGARTQSYGGTTYLTHGPFGDDVGGVQALRDIGVNGGWYGLRARPDFASLFGGMTTDVRGGVRTGTSAIVFTPGQTLSLSKTIDNYNEGYRVQKYRNVTSAGVGGSDQTFSDVDYPMFRLADAYLMYAEAVVRGAAGSRATALQYVNALRARANAPTVGDADLTLQFVLDERARELFWEGHRRTDLIRFGQFTGAAKLWQFKGGAAAGTATDAKYNLYPLPANELSANPGLTQNPGY